MIARARRCHRKMRTISECIAACRLGWATEWCQLHADDTSRAQVTMTSACMRIEEEEQMNVIALTAHHVSKTTLLMAFFVALHQ